MFYKVTVFALILALLMSLTGCKAPETPETEPVETTTEPSVQDPVVPETTEPVATKPPKGEFALEREELTLITAGETWNIYAGTVDASLVTWTSEDESVATVENGIVTAVSKGETTVTAVYEGQTLTCKVYCNLHTAPGNVPEITVDPTDPPEENPNAGQRDPVYLPPTDLKVDSSFFDDAVFVGDSVSLKLSYYAGSSGLLGNAKFLTRGSYGVANGVYDYLLLTWQGQEMTIEDAIQATGASKLFIMLGMNDVALYGVDKTIEHWGMLLERIRSKNPTIEIYIQSMTPVWTGGEIGDLNNTTIDAYNAELEVFARENGCRFIDVAPYMKDSTGGLATAYCSDQYVHFTDAGSDTWIKVLKAYNGY